MFRSQNVLLYLVVSIWPRLHYLVKVGQRDSGSNCSQMFSEKAVLKNFPIFTGKHLFQSLFLIKLETEGV